MKVVGYPTPGKAKAATILDAFCFGARGYVVEGAKKLEPDGAAAFYGVTQATKPLWEQAKAEGRPWFYLDNAYFDACRGVYFRATRDRLQHPSTGTSDGKRFAALGLEIKPWRKDGRHVIVAPQSDEFMAVCAGYTALRGRWIDQAIGELYLATDRELRVLPWNRDKAAWYAALPANLLNCWALITYSSASAISALLAGVPAIVTAEDCIVACACRAEIGAVEEPPMPEDRAGLMAVIADQQWTLDEMRSGLAWEMLHAA